ncbi:cupin domain-containing protein [Piscinibacter sakaiensis]|uniref:cupin domain-containing protein n=1 Tax=Piscinibacter sakaiensis TaxID=1547922 RepID=UPI003AAEA079
MATDEIKTDGFAELSALLAGELMPEPADEAGVGRLRRKILNRIASAETGRHLTVQPGDGHWNALGGGLELKVLHRHGDLMSYLVRMAPGSVLPPHRHPVDEECVVLDGEVQVGELRIGPGGFHLGRKDLPHAAVRSDGGALIFLRGAVPDLAHLI